MLCQTAFINLNRNNSLQYCILPVFIRIKQFSLLSEWLREVSFQS